ncbi:hypothetical protein MTO96_048158 [Rhipicephalus appendiculatus]
MSTRWASLLVLVSTVLSWSSGVAAEHQRSRGLYVCFSVSTIMLGVFIVTLRIATEDQSSRRRASAGEHGAGEPFLQPFCTRPCTAARSMSGLSKHTQKYEEITVRRRLLIKVGLNNAVADVSSPASVLSWSREESLSSSRNSFPDSTVNNTVSSAVSTPEVHHLKVFNPAFK